MEGSELTSEASSDNISPWRKYSDEEKAQLREEALHILNTYELPTPTEKGPRRFTLPKGFQVRYRKCGKSNCKCAGGSLHGPYLYKVQWDTHAKTQHWTYIGRFEL